MPSLLSVDVDITVYVVPILTTSYTSTLFMGFVGFQMITFTVNVLIT
ncbi:hypothetical protein [Vulcanisaeta sp. EB80]|nr:hypothetical protein [Vulcanisaeta sp. EB80]